jgi:hypothetical protein
MFPWGLRVSIIEPGMMRTPIIQPNKKPFSEFWASLPSDVQERWGEDFLKSQYGKGGKNIFVKYAEDPIKVVRALEHAVMNTVPHIRYRPGWQSGLLLFPISMLPAWIVDWLLNNLSKSRNSPASVSKQLQN